MGISHCPPNPSCHNGRMEKDTAKIVLSKALKRWFKSLCVDTDNEMSAVVVELLEQWCLTNDRTITIAKLIQHNLTTLERADISNLDALISGGKPTQADLVKLSTALGIKAEILKAISDRSFNGHKVAGGKNAGT